MRLVSYNVFINFVAFSYIGVGRIKHSVVFFVVVFYLGRTVFYSNCIFNSGKLMNSFINECFHFLATVVISFHLLLSSASFSLLTYPTTKG